MASTNHDTFDVAGEAHQTNHSVHRYRPRKARLIFSIQLAVRTTVPGEVNYAWMTVNHFLGNISHASSGRRNKVKFVTELSSSPCLLYISHLRSRSEEHTSEL